MRLGVTAKEAQKTSSDLSGTIVLGQNLSTRNTRQLGTVGRTMVALQPFKLANTVTQDLPLDQETVIHDASWFGQATLDVKDQLHLVAALRNDGSSTFGAQNLRSWFPRGRSRGSSRRRSASAHGCRTARRAWRMVRPGRSRFPT